MSTSAYHSVKYIDGHPILPRSYSVKGKTKASPELKLKHGCEFMELAIALDPKLLDGMPSSSGDGITESIRLNKEMQMKAYDSLAFITSKATRFFCSVLQDNAVQNAMMLGARMTQTRNPHYNDLNEIVSTPTTIHSFSALLTAISSESFRKEASTTSYNADCYFRFCYMLTDNFRERELERTAFVSFARKWGPFHKHAVIDVCDPKEHDFHNSWSDACDQIREKIINAQICCLRRCFLYIKPTSKSKSKDLSCEYIIERSDGKPPVKGHLGFETIDDLAVYEYASKSNNKIFREECAIQYYLGKISSILCGSGDDRAHLHRFISSQSQSQFVSGKYILFLCLFIMKSLPKTTSIFNC